jgi:hypothetical protein
MSIVRFERAVVLVLVCVAWGHVPDAAAQPPGQPIDCVVGTPVQSGQWQGPYDLVQITNEHPSVPLGEIVHAMVLPSAEGEVLFWCRNAGVGISTPDPTAHGGAWGPTHTFVWKPNDPQRATKYTVPNANDGSEDLFCGGQQFLANGDPIAFGGTNVPFPSANPYGHSAAFRFDMTLRQWFAMPSMTMPRWYPHGFQTTDGHLTVLGHISEPAQWPVGSGVEIVTHNDYLASGGTGTWTRAENRPLGTDPLPCSGSSNPSEFIRALDYPRAYVLGRENMLMYTVLRTPKRNRFLDLAVDCSSSSGGAFLHPWRSYLPANAGDHYEGSGAHFLYFDASNQPAEVVYAVGGESSASNPAANVERLTNPSAISQPNWDTSAPDLQHARTHLNVVIGALGEMYAVGGEGVSGSVHCVERYRTPEVFGDVPDSWALMAPHSDARTYHSVAGLLPDGRIFHAGGEETGAHHSVEIYQPPYLFLGPRPVVDNVQSPTNWTYGATRQFDVTLRQGVTFAGTHLIKLGSVTHGFDSSQRFVELEKVFETSAGINKVTIAVKVPPDAASAPVGHYWLIAVDSAGVPSVAQLVHLP